MNEQKAAQAGDTARTARPRASRLAELFFATGIPTVGFFLAAREHSTLESFGWFYSVILLAGWHVIAFNDLCFGKNSIRKESLRPVAVFLPVLLVPLALVAILALSGNWSFAAAIALTIVNWDAYSLWGKRRWLSGLLHNTIAGALHFSTGTAAAGTALFCGFPMETIFFALAMSAAAMHHDASHTVEDMLNHYRTGAVAFGHEWWWRRAIIPMSISVLPLRFSDKLFSVVFTFCLIVYLLSYIAFILSNSTTGLMRRFAFFRMLCRGIFGFGGLVFIVLSAIRLLQS